MNRTATPREAFRGTTVAGALLFDVPTIGETQAQQRVLAHWQPDSVLRALPGGQWILTLPEPLEIRAELAPGQPLIHNGGGWSMPGLTADADTFTLYQAGEAIAIPIDATKAVDTSSWVDLSDLEVHRLEPFDRPAAIAEIPVLAIKAARPDLRKAAGIGETSTLLAKLRHNLDQDAARADAAAGRSGRSERRSERGSGGRSGRLGGWFGGSGRSGGGPGKSVASGKDSRAAGWLSGLIARSSFGSFLVRREQRYVHKLTTMFERGQFDEALKSAIGLGGTASGKLNSLWIHRPRRNSLTPGSTTRSGAALPYATTAYAHLKDLYLEAARELERTGRIQEAAFIYADLLNDGRGAVDLLERHGHLNQAAELAESENLEAPLVIRLWWQAGNRQRAVEIARTRGAFAAGIERLHAVDPTLARDLRIAWINSCRKAGDPVAAVDAAWPDGTLREMVLPDIAAGLAMGGPRSAYLFAHLVTARPTAENLTRSLALLDSDDVESRRRFTDVMTRLRSTDRMQDRQLATASLRSMLRDNRPDTDEVRRAVAIFRDRCDPLLRADLPRLQSKETLQGRPIELAFDDQPGALRVYDAVALRGGAVLVAHGEQGVRLLTYDGRTRARWDVPVHSLVVADHGGTALLVTESESLRTIRRLDLSTRTVRPWTTLPAWRLLPSYDGGLLPVINEDGLAFIDTLQERPKTLWRELDRTHIVLAVNRTPTILTALVQSPTVRFELLSWELPSLTLRARTNMEDRPAEGPGALLPKRLVDGAVSSSSSALIRSTENGFSIEVDDRPVAIANEEPKLRQHDGLVTLWTSTGQLAVLDPSGPALRATFRTRL